MDSNPLNNSNPVANTDFSFYLPTVPGSPVHSFHEISSSVVVHPTDPVETLGEFNASTDVTIDRIGLRDFNSEKHMEDSGGIAVDSFHTVDRKDDASSDTNDDNDGASEDEDENTNVTLKMTAKEREKALIEIDEMNDDNDNGLISGSVIRSKNEIIKLPPVAPIDVEIPPHLPLCPVGTVYAVVDDLVIVQAEDISESRVLDAESILLFDDRKVLGKVFETFGPVKCPLYSIRFNTPNEIDSEFIFKGKKVFYIPDLAVFVFTQLLLGQKGSDASNLFDEEVDEH
ncbi:hypothetical protein HK096_001039, partial [Nowakowskiella sp. JEL0078]